MAEAFQIVSVTRTETTRQHFHISEIGTAPRAGSPSRWPITSVLDMLAHENLFFINNDLGEPVFASHYRCDQCGFETIKTTADKTTDQLDSLPMCDWRTSS